MLTCHLRAVSWQVFLEMLGRPRIMRRPCSNKFATRGGQLRKFIVAVVGDLSGSPGRFASHVSIALLAIMWFSTDRLSVGGSGGRGSGRFQLPSSRRPASQDAIHVWTVTVGPVLGNAGPSVHVVAGGVHANRVLPFVIHDIMAPYQFRAFVRWTLGSKAASRSRVICVSKAIICIVRDINQAWRKVLWASESLSSALLWSGVCRCPFLMVGVGVAVSQGVVYDSPDSRHSVQLQLCSSALGRGLVSGMTSAITARSRNNARRFALRLQCLCQFVG